MKSYREIADSVFERRERYIAAQQRKRKHTVSAIASICSCALVALVGASVWRSGVLTENPPISEGKPATTTVTKLPVTEGTAPSVTASHSGIVSPTTPTTSILAPSQTTPSKTQPPTATTPSKTQPPATTPSKTEPSQTTAPSKTEPTQTTAPTALQKVLVVADTNDNTGNFDEGVLSIKKRYLSRRLKETMAYYEGEDYYKGGDIVVYAVVVSMPYMKEYSDDFWNSNEEWAQIFKEMDEVYDAFDKEAHRLNPSWDGVDSRDIEIWTDTMRANYERYLTLIEVRNSIHDEYYAPYVEMILEQQFEALNAVSSTEPVDICENSFLFYNAYYAELTADAINTLAERGGYTFSLAMANQRDYSGHWVGDE